MVISSFLFLLNVFLMVGFRVFFFSLFSMSSSFSLSVIVVLLYLCVFLFNCVFDGWF